MAQLSDDCFAVGGSLLAIDAAQRMIVERVTPVAGIERVPLRQALGRIQPGLLRLAVVRRRDARLLEQLARDLL